MINIFLKELREENNYSQKQIAEFLNVDQSLIAKFEKGERNLNIDSLQRLAYLYGIEYSKLIKEDKSKPLKIAYRAKELSNEDLESIAKINKIILNLRFLENMKDEHYGEI